MGRHRCRAGVASTLVIWIGVGLASGCQDGYPIAPTQCDEWCEASHGLACVRYDPAGCVFTCRERGGDAPECAGEFAPVLACLRDVPKRPVACEGERYEDRPCWAELSVFAACTVRFAKDGYGSLEW